MLFVMCRTLNVEADWLTFTPCCKMSAAFRVFSSTCFYMNSLLFFPESSLAVTVTCPTKRFIVILFQPVTLTCDFQSTASQPPVIMWKYKSYCRDPVQAALNPSSADNILAQNNPNYNPTIECGDSQRTVRTVASKQGDAVTLGKEYSGRKISIVDSKLISARFVHIYLFNNFF